MRAVSNSRADDRDFFLPDLCASQPLLLLIVVSQLMALVVTLARSGLTEFDWQVFGQAAFYALWVTIPSAWLLCRLRPRLARLPGRAGPMVAYALVLLMALLVSVAGRLFLDQGLPFQQLSTLLTQLLITAIVTGVLFRYLYLQQQLNRQQQAELKARLDALQARMHPHFLFNSMNIIASLIATAPDKAEQAVEDLAELFRASLASADTEVSLGHELELCRRYLALESLRLGERLRVHWQDEGVSPQLPIPLLTLQPLLENAIVHGIQTRVEGGDIHIRLHYDAGRLYLEVRNPQPAMAVSERHGNRIALDNIRDRLHNLYGESASLALDCSGENAVARLSYPVAIGGGKP